MKKVIALVLLLCIISGGVALRSAYYLGDTSKLINAAEGPNWPADDEDGVVVVGEQA